MQIAIPREIKNNEHRVALTPAGARELTARGHAVFVETGAGQGSSISDDEYLAAGAEVLPSPGNTWATGELVLKVKEPVPDEYPHLRRDQVLFTYLHLAASSELTAALLEAGVTAIAYETVRDADGNLPLLAPMSEVAGRLAAQVGAQVMLRPAGGRGVLPGGVPGVPPARVAVLGGGVAGLNAAAVALGMGADVELLDTDVPKLREVDRDYGGRIRTITSNSHSVEHAVRHADLVIGAVLIPGAKAPKLVSDQLVSEMRPGSVLVDIAIDQGGCFEGSRATTHDEPTYPVHRSIFYCVANMPGSVPNTSTHALTNVTLPYALRIADEGWRAACRADPALAQGLSTHGGSLMTGPVAQAHGFASRDADELLA